MRALRYVTPRHAEIVDVATPKLAPGHVLTKSLFCNISAGTELAFYRGTAPQMNAGTDRFGLFVNTPNALTYPMTSSDPNVWWMGYANVSQVLEAGANVKHLKTGDVVFAQAPHKELQHLSESACNLLPPGTNPEHASLTALVEIAYNGILDAGLRLMENVTVFGLGTLGLLLVQMAKRQGCNVIAVDGLDNRLALARTFGADLVLNLKEERSIAGAVYDFTGGIGSDTVFEVSGNAKALPEAVRAAGFNAKVVVVSFYQETCGTLDLGKEFHHKRVQIVSSQIGGLAPVLSGTWNAGRRRHNALRLLGRLDIESLISHRIGFEEVPQALHMMDEHPSACNAVVIKY